MTAVGWVWAIALLCALWFLPMGIARMVAFETHQVDRPSWLRGIAWLSLGLGTAAALVFAALTVWFFATGRRPA